MASQTSPQQGGALQRALNNRNVKNNPPNSVDQEKEPAQPSTELWGQKSPPGTQPHHEKSALMGLAGFARGQGSTAVQAVC